MLPKLSIIIPTYNEFDQLAKKVESLSHLKKAFKNSIEIIILDSNSTDDSIKWLKQLQEARVAAYYLLSLKPGQIQSIGVALNQACNLASADSVLILPVDIEISTQQVEKVLHWAGTEAKWGCFFKRYDSLSFVMRFYCFLQNQILTKCLQQGVWTNVFFLKKNLSHLFPEIGFLEDVVFSDRLKSHSKGVIITDPVRVSVRKYNFDGLFRRIFYNGVIIFLYRCGYRNYTALKDLYVGRIGLRHLLLKKLGS